MTEPRPSEAHPERRLERMRADYEATKARLAEVGFTCEGSLVERYTTCNNPNCRCADPAQRHGPYYQLSWKEGAKTVSRACCRPRTLRCTASGSTAHRHQDETRRQRATPRILADFTHSRTAAGHGN